jgi:aspartate racemase
LSSPSTIGILGGLGPEATILLQRKLVEAIPADDDRDHIPLLIDTNPQVPSRIANLIEGTGDSPAPVLANMARRLQHAGAKALAMPCNTAHHFAGAITQAVDIPLLNMVELAADHADRVLGLGGRVGACLACGETYQAL